MQGYIVYNGFWNTQDIPDPVKRLSKAAEARGHHLEPRPNLDFAVHIKNGALTIPGIHHHPPQNRARREEGAILAL